MKKSLKSFVAAVAFAATAMGTSATVSADDTINAYADCGIGAGIFENDTAAIISNVIWDLGTTALTSKMSSPETCEGGGAKVTAAKFIYESYANLEEDLAAGKGEHLSAVLNILSCSGNEKAISNMRKNFASQVSSETYENQEKIEKAEALYNSVTTECGSLS